MSGLTLRLKIEMDNSCDLWYIYGARSKCQSVSTESVFLSFSRSKNFTAGAWDVLEATLLIIFYCFVGEYCVSISWDGGFRNRTVELSEKQRGVEYVLLEPRCVHSNSWEFFCRLLCRSRCSLCSSIHVAWNCPQPEKLSAWDEQTGVLLARQTCH